MKIFSCTSQDGITKNAVSLKDGLTVTFFPESDVGVLPRGTKLEVN